MITKVLTKVMIFLIALSIIFLKPKILGFLFCMKNSLTGAVKCEKLNFTGNRRKFIRQASKIVHEWNVT